MTAVAGVLWASRFFEDWMMVFALSWLALWSCAIGLAVVLWSAFTETFVRLDRESLTIRRRGWLERREQQWPRTCIGAVRRTGGKVVIFDTNWKSLAHLDGYGAAEDAWIARTLREALGFAHPPFED